MRVACDSDTFEMFSGKNIKKTTIAHTVTILDAITTLLLLFMLYTLQYAQRSTASNLLKQTYSTASYTLQIKGLPQGLPVEKATSLLWSVFNEKLENNKYDRVSDVQIVLPNRHIGYRKRIEEIISKVFNRFIS